MSSSLKIASWNINSIRARVGIVEKFLTEEAPDILCLQETKVRDSEFPHALFHRLGYDHIIICGQPMHHGVAIASRVPMREDDRHDWQDNGEARHVGVRLECGIRLENVYVPAGGDIPDRDAQSQIRPEARLHRADDALVRDAAPARRSWSATSTSRRSNATSGATSSCSTSSATRPIEVEALTRLQDSNDWVDLGRHFHPAPQAAAHLVELPLARLDRERPRPPARPYVGDRATSRSWRRRTWSTSPAATGSGRRDHVPLLTEFAL